MDPFLCNTMKTTFYLAAVLVLSFGAGISAAADAPPAAARQEAPNGANDMNAIAAYADQLSAEGVTGPQFVKLVDQRYWKLHPSANENPADRGVGALVQELQSRGLHGQQLANAIEQEQRSRATRIDQSSRQEAQPREDANSKED